MINNKGKGSLGDPNQAKKRKKHFQKVDSQALNDYKQITSEFIYIIPPNQILVKSMNNTVMLIGQFVLLGNLEEKTRKFKTWGEDFGLVIPIERAPDGRTAGL